LRFEPLYLDYARSLFSPVPYAVAKFSSRRVRHSVQALLAERRFDVAVCDFLSASGNFPRRLETPSVLFQHNVESVLWKRQAAHEPGLLKRIAFKVEAAKMSRYERAAVRRFPRVVAVSDRDRGEMARMTDPARVSVVPTGVDVERYRAASGTSPDRPTVMFLGSMDWEANIDAADYFCREMWPSIRSAVPDALLRIVGRSPHPRVRRLASPSVDITGSVPSVLDHLKETAVFVVPLRIGGGTRLKIFEAMAAEKAVVSTSIGAEGLDVTDGRDILLADTPRGFADSVIALLRDPVRRRQLERAAGHTAARHDWSVIARRFEDVLREAIARPDRVDRLAVATARVEA
jgi:glycosyltransferase involved in cell wall biosynthesis